MKGLIKDPSPLSRGNVRRALHVNIVFNFYLGGKNEYSTYIYIDAILMPNINSLNELPFVDINRLSNSE